MTVRTEKEDNFDSKKQGQWTINIEKEKHAKADSKHRKGKHLY